MKIAILGAGAWGTAMAVYLERNGHEVILLCRSASEATAIGNCGENRARLAGIPLKGVRTLSLDVPLQVDLVLVSVPSHAVDEVLERSRLEAALWASLAKGVVLETLTTPCETIEKAFSNKGLSSRRVWSLAGPSHAESVAKGLPCALVLSGEGNELRAVQEALSSPQLRVYAGTDRRGAELGGALKNTFAVAAGLCDGLRMGDNAKAALLTRALAEMVRLGVALGGQRETFFGLTGAGDLMATSYGPWSRNRQLGEAVAKGLTAGELMQKAFTAEGYRASLALRALARKQGLEAPILEEVAAILHEGRSAKESLQRLMVRPLKSE